MQQDELLARVADRSVAALLGDLCTRVAALEGREPSQAGQGGAGGVSTETLSGPDALAFALNGKLAAVLVAGGYDSPAAVAAASDDQLLAVWGINAKAVKLIRERIKG